MKNKKHTSRELSDHVDGKVVINDDAGAIDNEHIGVEWEATQGEVHSSTTLEDDTGFGEQAVIRFFDYGANPEMFRVHTPTKQELFNSHFKEIEAHLLESGLKILEDVKPQLLISPKKDGYRIVVGATPLKSHLVTWANRKTQTLKEISDGNS